jgi:hypothetical protein
MDNELDWLVHISGDGEPKVYFYGTCTGSSSFQGWREKESG